MPETDIRDFRIGYYVEVHDVNNVCIIRIDRRHAYQLYADYSLRIDHPNVSVNELVVTEVTLDLRIY